MAYESDFHDHPQVEDEEVEIEIKFQKREALNNPDIFSKKPKMTPEQFERGVYSRLIGHQKKKEKKIAKMKIQVIPFS